MRYGFDSILACRALDGNLVGSPFDSRLNPLPNQPKIPRQIRKLLSRALIHIIIDILFSARAPERKEVPPHLSVISTIAFLLKRLSLVARDRIIPPPSAIRRNAALHGGCDLLLGDSTHEGNAALLHCFRIDGCKRSSMDEPSVFLAFMLGDVSEIQV